jgi:hypothetical protein
LILIPLSLCKAETSEGKKCQEKEGGIKQILIRIEKIANLVNTLIISSREFIRLASAQQSRYWKCN